MTGPIDTSPTTLSHAALADLWALGGGDACALGDVRLVGADPVLPSSFRIGLAAQASIAAAGLAATALHRQRGGGRWRPTDQRGIKQDDGCVLQTGLPADLLIR